VLNEERELRDGRGILVRLTSQTEGINLVFDPDSATEPLPIVASKDAKTKWKVRRWDHVTDSNKTPTILAQNTWIALEDGVEVQFTAGDHYETGDYWLIPARTITGNVDWPLDDDDKPLPQQRHGIMHHYCRLATLRLGAGNWQVLSDCRPIFSPLIGQQNLFYVGGDGGEAMPGEELQQPLEVGVSQGQEPIPLAHVRFEVIGESGTLNLIQNSNTEGGKELDVLTGPDGLTKCYWKLAPFDAAKNNQSQQVEVKLLDPADQQIHLRFRFTANLSRAAATAYPLPTCGNDDSTILGLIPDIIASLPQAANRTIQEILDIILCRLDADRLPFQPDCDIYPPETTKTIGTALNGLCLHLLAKHIGYEVPECGNQPNALPTVQSLFRKLVLGWPDLDKDNRATVRDMLDALFCRLDADTLPFQHIRDTGLYPPEVQPIVGEALNYLVGRGVPPGAIMAFASEVAPPGWLECNGQLISRTTFNRLFQTIGTRFGAGDEATTFNVPDLRGEFIRGWIHGRSDVPGETGRAFGSSQPDAVQTHIHLDSGHTHIDAGHAHTITEQPHSHSAPTSEGLPGAFEVASTLRQRILIMRVQPDFETATDYY
jgi:microcystin-dependent protein